MSTTEKHTECPDCGNASLIEGFDFDEQKCVSCGWNIAVSYVVGFLFDADFKHIILIRKKRPLWQRGLLNGVGGKIEPTDPDPASAMYREFLEETNIAIVDWKLFQVERFANAATVYFYWAVNSVGVLNAETMTDEEVNWYPLRQIPYNVCLPNLQYLIPMALTKMTAIPEEYHPIL